MNGKGYKTVMILAVLGLNVGSWGMVDRFIHGHISGGFGSYVPWGLWVIFYLLFVGLTAGAFLVTIISYVFEVKRFKSIGRLSAFTVLIALICELTFITLDLGHIGRLYRFLITPSFTSLMTWFVIFTNAMLVIYILESFFLLREDLVLWSRDKKRKGNGIYRLLALGKSSYSPENRLRDEKRVHILSLISLPVGLLFYGTNGAFFAILMNRPIWNSALTPLLFIMAALLSGGALITFLIYIFQHDDELVRPLGRIIFFLLTGYLFLELLQFFVGYQTATVPIVTSLDLIAFGPHWWTFWIVHVLIGGLIPIYVLISRSGDSKAIAWACFLIVLTFASVRFNFLIPDLSVYKLEGLETTFFHNRLRTDYTPSLVEWLVSVWIISFGILIYVAGMRWLPVLTSTSKGGEKHA
jgi:molybdopterin-containing oxidoreductase family membrane subunit